ncbi:MAG: DUF4351 domain-containing protein [Cyanobacteriota bacterium]|nr:DUF4351 domain-containing protein [Cyanobacteriota bacterium]
MAYDNTCKYLAETYAPNFVRWLLGINPTNVQVIKTEIIPEPIRSDALILLQIDNKILHLEFQTFPYSDPPIPYRMLKYWTLLYGQYWCDIEQVVILLKEINSELVFQNKFERQNTRHSYRVIRLWEEESAPFLADNALLPLATLTRSESPTALLSQVADRIGRIEEPSQQRNISAAAEILGGLRFDKNLIRQLLREEIMKESVIYQDILQKGEQRGEQRGLQKGQAMLVITLITHRFGDISKDIEAKIRSLSISQLNELAIAQLNFTSMDDLISWLNESEN